MELFNKVFCGNVFDGIIRNYLSLTDVFRLSLVNGVLFRRMNKEYFYNIIRTRIETRLRKILGKNFLPFIKMMVRTRAVLSGSFIHQCVYDESWDNSDIDIYVGKRNQDKTMIDFLKTISAYSDTDYGELYKKAFDTIVNITNHYIDHKNVISLDDIDIIKKNEDNNYDYYYYNKNNPIYQAKERIKNQCVKIQLVCIKTNEKYDLWNHIQNTGFDVCKNMVYYDKNLNMKLQIYNYKELIFRRSTFVIQNISDFYYRIDKYTKRGFHFRPKYNKLLYLEYLFMKFAHVHILKTDFNEKEYDKHKGQNCGVNCPIKLLFRDVRHYHTLLCHDRTNDDSTYYYYGCYDVAKVTTVENIDGTFNAILPQLKTDGKKIIDNGLLSRNNLQEAVRWNNCEDMHAYAKIRNNYTNKPISVYSRTKEYKYDIQYGLPCIVRTMADRKKKINVPIKKKVPMTNIPTQKKVPMTNIPTQKKVPVTNIQTVTVTHKQPVKIEKQINDNTPKESEKVKKKRNKKNISTNDNGWILVGSKKN